MSRRTLGCAGVLVVLAGCLGTPSTCTATDTIERAGDVLQIAMPVLSAGGALADGDRDGLRQFALSAAVSLGATRGLKSVIDSERPDGGDHSFPSGHATIAFCSAEFVRGRYGWKLGVPMYAAACFVGYSRVESERHHARDVVAGAMIGVVCSMVFVSPSERVTVETSVYGDSRRLAIVYRW